MKVLDSRWAPWLLGGLLVVGLAWPALDPAVQLFYRDTGRCAYQLKLFIAGQLAIGQSPFWDPWVESGAPILTQVTPGLFHPLTLLDLAPFDLAFKLNHLLALPLAFASMMLLCSQTGASRWASTAAAAAYAGSGWVVSVTNSNLHYALAAGAMPLAVHGLRCPASCEVRVPQDSARWKGATSPARHRGYSASCCRAPSTSTRRTRPQAWISRPSSISRGRGWRVSLTRSRSARRR